MLPYVDTQLVVPGAAVCRFEFYSQETTAEYERYVSGKRYRLNHWQPIVDTFPHAAATGLKFKHYYDDPLVGMVSTWTLMSGFDATVDFFVSDYSILKSPNKKESYLDMGVGFMRYFAPYWKPIDAQEFAVHRRIGVPTHFHFTGLHQVPVGPVFPCMLGKRVKYTMTIRGATLSISAVEYGDDGETAVAHAYHSMDVPEGIMYRAAFFVRGTKDTSAKATLVKTTFKGARDMRPSEIIYFDENPTTFKFPDANIRMSKLPLIQQPHTAYIEDGSLELASPMTPPLWFDMMRYLVDYSVEPCLFTDVEGNQWLVCLGSLTGDGPSNRRGKIRSGYTLQLPVLVLH